MAKKDRTKAAIFTDPVLATIKWRDIESMLKALGAVVEEAEGSRVRVHLNGVIAVFHRPHPQPEAKKYTVRGVRGLLVQAGITP